MGTRIILPTYATWLHRLRKQAEYPKEEQVGSDAVAERAHPLPALTGVRGVAAMAVFLCHAQPIALRTFGFDADAGWAVVGSGFRGVDLFFILSGFILFHVHARDFIMLQTPLIKRFYVLRFFRVYPLNTVVLLVMVPLPLFWPQFVDWHRILHLPQGAYHARDFSMPGFFQSLLLAQTWTGVKLGVWNEPAWTLSAEVFGYVCFPALAMMAAKLRSSAETLLLIFAGLAGFALLMVVGGHATNNPSGTFGLIRMGSCFLAGIGLCRLHQLNPDQGGLATWLGLVAVLGIGLCFWQVRFGVLSVFGFAGLILALAYQTGPIARFMTSPVVMWLGRISFSFYIIHLIPLEAFERLSKTSAAADPASAASMFAAAVALPFLLAALMHRYIEVPSQRLGRRLSARAAVPDRPSRAAHGPAERASGSSP